MSEDAAPDEPIQTVPEPPAVDLGHSGPVQLVEQLKAMEIEVAEHRRATREMHNSILQLDEKNAQLRRSYDDYQSSLEREFRNTMYYSGLLDDIAKTFGKDAFISDDGSVQQDPLRAKMPQLVAELHKKYVLLSEMAFHWRAQLRDITIAMEALNSWYGGDSSEEFGDGVPRALVQIVRDAVTDLQNDRMENMKLRRVFKEKLGMNIEMAMLIDDEKLAAQSRHL